MHSRDNEAIGDSAVARRSRPPRRRKPAPEPKTLLCDTVGRLLTEEEDDDSNSSNSTSSLSDRGWCCLLPDQHVPHCRSRGKSSNTNHNDLINTNNLNNDNNNTIRPPSPTVECALPCQNSPPGSDRGSSGSSSPRLRSFTAFVHRKTSPGTPDKESGQTRETLQTVEQLAACYGRASHMGILDDSYHFFLNRAHTGAVCYKMQHHNVAIVAGDPLCPSGEVSSVLDEFDQYRRHRHWKLAFIGASASLARYAHERHWTTIEFGVERVLNPMTNDVLLERSGKRILVQNRQLLHPTKKNLALRIYIPAYQRDPGLQTELVGVYEAWRRERRRVPHAFVTVQDLFHFPALMVYIYTRNPEGKVNGFVALRWIGKPRGYHLDPCVMAPDAPRGVSDLLIYATLAYLRSKGVSYLSLGFEPLEELREIRGMPPLMDRVTQLINKRVFRKFQLQGKKKHHDKFRTDGEQESSLYVLLPSGILDLPQVFGVLHTANIHIRKLL